MTTDFTYKPQLQSITSWFPNGTATAKQHLKLNRIWVFVQDKNEGIKYIWLVLLSYDHPPPKKKNNNYSKKPGATCEMALCQGNCC